MSGSRWTRILAPAVAGALVLGIVTNIPAQKVKAAGPTISMTACVPAQFCVDPSTFGTGAAVTVHGSGFGAGASVIVWLDKNGNSQFDEKEPSVQLLANGSGGLDATFTVDEVAAGPYLIRAGTVHNPTTGEASVAVTVNLGVDPPRFGSGSTITVTGYGFTPLSTLNVWFDGDNDATLGGQDTSTSVSTGSHGDFTTTIKALGHPNFYRFNAGPASTATGSAAADIGTCWFQDCFIDGADTICIFGNSPTDFLSFFADCKAVDSNYSATGYDLTNKGPAFAGAGALAAMLQDILPPPTGCVQMAAALALAGAYGNTVPDSGFDVFKPFTDLTDIACGDAPAGFPVPFDLGAYEIAIAVGGHSVPDIGVLLGVVPLIHTAAAAAAAAVITAGVVGTAAGPIAISAALGALSGLVGPEIAAAMAGSIGAEVSALSAASFATAPVLQLAILTAVQTLIAQGAVAGAVACGRVSWDCLGSDITATVIGNPALQQWQIPISIMQPPFMGPADPNVCRPAVGATPMNGRCWASIIGWAEVTCKEQSTDPAKSCEAPGIHGDYPRLPIPGTAGPNNVTQPEQCVTGKIVGQSIGYDGDVSFDVFDPNTQNLLNYHNFAPGPGGTDPPGGMDIEIPLADRNTYMDRISILRVGMHARVCGRYVADMHMLWNELHPVTSLTLLLQATGHDFSSTEGSAFSGTVATFTVPDKSAPASQFAASINWGDGSSSAGTVTGSNGSFTVTGGHSYVEEGVRTAVTTITDAHDADDTGSADSVATVADAALSGSASPVAAVEGAGFSSTVYTFTDANPSATMSDFTSSLSWGDGNTSAGTVSANGSGGFNVNATHTYAEEGSFTFTVTVRDVGGSTSQGSAIATVADAALAASGTNIVSTNPVSAVVATFTDADPNGTPSDYAITINWGDGTAPTAGTAAASGSGGFTAAGTHTYAVLGPYTVNTHICDVGGSCANASSTLTVFAFATGGAFAIGDVSLGPPATSTGKTVYFWGSQWAKNNTLSGAAASPAFKGFENQPSVPACGVTWTATLGASSPTPATIPSYMAVVVTDGVVQNGNVVSGTVVHIVVMRVDPGYGPSPGTPGTGTVVAVFC